MTEENKQNKQLDQWDKMTGSEPKPKDLKEAAAELEGSKESPSNAGNQQNVEKQGPSTGWKSQVKNIAQRALIGLIILLIVFGAGALTVSIGYYRPAIQELGLVEQEVVQANERIQDLEGQVAKLKTFETANQAGEAELAKSQTHVALLRILADVNTARIALEMDDPASAKLYLSKTPQKVEQLGKSLGTENEAVISSMLQRLKLVSDEINRSKNTALTDLALIASELIQIENTFFTTP
jgi:hypothetical protein